MAAQYKNQVRIIGGQWKRRLLPFPQIEGLRPTPDRVRETLFNWLGQDCTGMVCLDLFAGSGALGFEAASRHASKVVMLDTARNVLTSLHNNQTLLGAKNLEILPGDGLRFLETSQQQFDLILLDPPFASDLLERALPLLPRLLKPQARVYIECARWPALQGWEILRQGKAGQVHYALIQLPQVCE